jgi:hypothetical protein
MWKSFRGNVGLAWNLVFDPLYGWSPLGLGLGARGWIVQEDLQKKERRSGGIRCRFEVCEPLDVFHLELVSLG